MKFGFKLFLASFVTTILAINFVGINLINKAYTQNIESEIDKSLIEINHVMNTIMYSVDGINQLSKSYSKNSTYFQIYIGNILIFTNFLDDNSYPEEKLLSEPVDDNIKIFIDREHIYSCFSKYNYTIISKKNKLHVEKEKEEEIDYFIKMSLSMSIAIALILSLIVHFMTKKIKKLSISVKEIERGNYETEIPNLGQDEIGEFAISFATMTDAIKKNVRKIEEISESRKIFIGNLTHEIRTPLTSIIGYSSLIKNNRVTNPKILENYNKKIYEEGKYIEAMRDKLMSIMTLETNAIKLEEKNISDFLINILDDLKITFKDVKFIINIEKNISKKYDADLFKSMITNLVKNAAKSKKKPTIKIIYTEDKLIIEDDGKGIPTEEIDNIKEPFYTLNKDRNRKISGMGLGLPLVFKIAEIHGWTINISSQIDKGTKITIDMEGNR